MKDALFSMAELTWAAGDTIGAEIREAYGNVQQSQTRDSLQIAGRVENVTGVNLPVFDLLDEGHCTPVIATSPTSAEACTLSPIRLPGSGRLIALGRGVLQMQRCREAFRKVLTSLCYLAGLQASFFILDDVIRTTNRRVNALEYVMIPKLEATIAYISAELDEQDREEFYRLKKIQAVKERIESSE